MPTGATLSLIHEDSAASIQQHATTTKDAEIKSHESSEQMATNFRVIEYSKKRTHLRTCGNGSKMRQARRDPARKNQFDRGLGSAWSIRCAAI